MRESIRVAMWKRSGDVGFLLCPYCGAKVEDKGLKRARHLTSRRCQAKRRAAALRPSVDPERDTPANANAANASAVSPKEGKP